MFDYFIGKNDIGLDYETRKENVPIIIKNHNIENSVKIIQTHKPTTYGTLNFIGRAEGYHEELASYTLLYEENIPQFKQHCYTAGYLQILGDEKPDPYVHFTQIMSDNQDLIDYIVKQLDYVWDEKYNPKQDCDNFIIKNRSLALAGKFDELKKRSKIFLKAHNKYNERRVPEHLFYLALIDKDVKKMKESLELLLEPRMARKSVYGIDNAFSFYLQTRVLILAKIAAHHGYDLGIDHPSAPKELIKIEPLKEYKIEYDFMKEFDFNYPQQVWIDKIQYTDKIVDYWRTKVEELEKKKRSFLGIKF